MNRIVCLMAIAAVGAGNAAAQSNVGTIEVTSSAVESIGPEQGVMRRDPSDIIKVSDLY